MSDHVHDAEPERVIFYLPGLDPAGPRRYQKLLVREANRHNMARSENIEISAASCSDNGMVYCDIRKKSPEEDQVIRYYFFNWSDLVSQYMRKGTIQSLILLLNSGSLLFRLMARFNLKSGLPFSFACLYSIILSVIYVGIAFGFSFIVFLSLQAHIGCVVSFSLAMMLCFLIMKSTLLFESKLYVYFFIRTLNFSRSYSKELPLELCSRLNELSLIISSILNKGHEVIIIGHSYGALLSPPLLDRLSNSGCLNKERTKRLLKFVHFGALHPLVTLGPNENWYKRSIERFSQREIPWVEVFSGYDLLNFPHYDPRERNISYGSGPSFRDIDFFENCSAPWYSMLRYRVFYNHFRYLFAVDKCCSYDYFDYLFSSDILRYWNPLETTFDKNSGP